MKRTFKPLLYFAISLIFWLPMHGVAEDCSCPKVTCGPCQKKVTIGKIVKFCDWGDINVCRKEICENVNFYFGCLSKQGQKNTPKEDESEGELELAYDKDKPSKKKEKRKPASTRLVKKRDDKIRLVTEGRIEAENDSRVDPGVTYSDKVIGTASVVASGVIVLHRGRMLNLKKDQKLFVEDEIINSEKTNKKVVVQFPEGKVTLLLKPKSKLIVSDPHSIVGRFQPFFYLVHGAVELDVEIKNGSFDLLAGQILTRTTAGKTSVNYEMGPQGLQVRVESHKGLAEVIRAQDLSGQSIAVKEGNFVSWVSETSSELFNMDEKLALAAEGFITPVFQMAESRRKELGLIKPPPVSLFQDWSKKGKNKTSENRDIASLSSTLCQAPEAGFQQCAWSCEGNAKGAENCQADKENVHCIRRVCNAAGQWGEPTAFASSYADLCPSSGVRVGECSP